MTKWQMGILLYIVANCVFAQFTFITTERKISALILIILLGVVFVIEYFERKKKRKLVKKEDVHDTPPRDV